MLQCTKDKEFYLSLGFCFFSDNQLIPIHIENTL